MKGQYIWGILLMLLSAGMVVACVNRPPMSYETLVQTNQQLSLENLRLQAALSTYQEEDGCK